MLNGDIGNNNYYKKRKVEVNLITYKTFAFLARNVKAEIPTCVLKYIYLFAIEWKSKFIFRHSIKLMNNPDNIQRLLPYLDRFPDYDYNFSNYSYMKTDYLNGFLHHYHRAIGINRDKIKYIYADKFKKLNGWISYFELFDCDNWKYINE